MQPSELDEAERLARELADYSDQEEITVNTHVTLDSIHDSDSPPKKQLKAGLIAIGSGIGLALLGGVATLLQTCRH